MKHIIYLRRITNEVVDTVKMNANIWFSMSEHTRTSSNLGKVFKDSLETLPHTKLCASPGVCSLDSAPPL